jgi:hypothetical protein
MPHEAIRLGDATSFVELRFLEHGAEATPSEGDVCLSVSARSETFSGEYDQVWIEKDDWRSFLGSLRRLERERTGQASLASMSPDEFAIHLKIVDRAGPGPLSNEYHVDVDPGLLRELVASFESIAGPAV